MVAQWLRGVAIVETDAAYGRSINVRRVDIRPTICADRVSAALVKKDEQEVRRVPAATRFGSRSALGKGPLAADALPSIPKPHNALRIERRSTDQGQGLLPLFPLPAQLELRILLPLALGEIRHLYRLGLACN